MNRIYVIAQAWHLTEQPANLRRYIWQCQCKTERHISTSTCGKLLITTTRILNIAQCIEVVHQSTHIVTIAFYTTQTIGNTCKSRIGSNECLPVFSTR
ncbi:MAG: hypothetical protein ACK4HE_04875 [Chitinophagaceae bacterium]